MAGGAEISVLGLLIVAAFLLFLIVMLIRRKPPTTEPSCARCGYPVRGLTDLQCPECGADFRTTGILTDRMRRRPFGVGSRVLLWTISILIVGSFISGHFMQAVRPYVTVSSHTMTAGSPQSQAYLDVHTRVQRRERSPSRYANAMTVLDEMLLIRVRTRDGRQGTLSHETQTGRVVLRVPDPAEPSSQEDLTFTTATLMQALAIDTADPQVRAECLAIDNYINAERRGGAVSTPMYFSSWASGASSRSGPGWPWLPWVVLAFWLIVWSSGVVYIVRRFRVRPSPDNA